MSFSSLTESSKASICDFNVGFFVDFDLVLPIIKFYFMGYKSTANFKYFVKMSQNYFNKSLKAGDNLLNLNSKPSDFNLFDETS